MSAYSAYELSRYQKLGGATRSQSGSDALRDAASALRSAKANGYLFLYGQRVPWEEVARWLDDRAAAHEPTVQDEREALEKLVYDSSGNVAMSHPDRGLMARQVAGALIAAGWSRTPRPVTDCGHPNHGSDEHNCRPFLPLTVSEEAIEAAAREKARRDAGNFASLDERLTFVETYWHRYTWEAEQDLRAALPHLSTGQSETRQPGTLTLMRRMLADSEVERDELREVIERVRKLVDGGLRGQMSASAYLALTTLLPDTPTTERSTS